jgi:hypothetical protein
MHLISDTKTDWLTVRQPCGDSDFDTENKLVRADMPRLLQHLHRAYVALYNESPVCMYSICRQPDSMYRCMVYVDSLTLCTVVWYM